MLLAVDHDRDGIPDPDDLTRVALSGDAIEAIGKGIIEWDAGDTGVMYCTSGLFEGLRKAMTKGRYGLSDGLAELAGLGRALTVDVTGAWWLDVDTPEALAEAERAVGGGLRSIG